MIRRTAIGFFIAPLVVAAMVAAVTPTAPGTLSDQLLSVCMTMLLWYWGAAFMTAALAVPAFVILTRMNLVRWWSALAVGLIVGFIGTLVVRSPSAPVLQGGAPLSIIGGISALVFWIISRPTRNY